MTHGKLSRLSMLALAVTCMLSLVPLASAQEPAGDPSLFGLELFEAGTVTPDHRAGAHPSVFTRFRFNSLPLSEGPDGWAIPHGITRRIEVDLPKGLVGNPMAVPRCTRRAFVAAQCPPQSQIGIAHPKTRNNESGGLTDFENRPVYNLVTDHTEAALFGIDVGIQGLTKYSLLRTSVRPDGGLRTVVDNLPSVTAVLQNELELWGVPYDENLCNPNHPDFDGTGPSPYAQQGEPCAATDPEDWERRPFMTAPTRCDEVPQITLRALSYEGRTDSRTLLEHPIEDCESLVFEPSIEVSPTNPSADGVSGLEFSLSVPQNEDPDGRATPHVRDVQLTLPEGVSINPGAADGLEACSDAAFGKGLEGPASCPAASKVGTLRVDSHVLDHPVPGDVYIGEPLPENRYRLFFYLDDGEGVRFKLAGSVQPDPVTGQLTTVFQDNPQTPFSKMTVSLRGGPRGVLAMPQACGPKTAVALVTPWSGQPPVTVSDTFDIGGECATPLPFGPTFSAGTATSLAGAFSPLAVTFTRPDRNQSISGVSVDIPQGLLAKVAGVPLCDDARANAGTCGEESRVGSVKTAAGPGQSPLFLDGTVSLTGPYKGAPYGLSVAVPAKAGPYDLGMVVVRQALHVDPSDASVNVVSDPLPQIVEGVLLRLQRVDVNVDRPGFTRNATDCTEKEIRATFTSLQGQTAGASTRYQATDCKALGFKPRLGLRLIGKYQTKTGRHPGVRAVVVQSGGQAGIDRAVVRLPKSLALDPDNAQALCEFEDGTKPDLENHCPKGSIVGRARAVTPLLNRPLVGNVYFVKNVRRDPRTGNAIRTLPMIVAALRGEIAINLRGESDSTNAGRLVSRFATVPDAPISRFNLNIRGGRSGILAVTGSAGGDLDICRDRQIAEVDMNGQNGKRRDFNVRVKTPCAKKRKAKRRR